MDSMAKRNKQKLLDGFQEIGCVISKQLEIKTDNCTDT